MKNINEILPTIREQVKAGIYESEEEAVEEYKMAIERSLR